MNNEFLQGGIDKALSLLQSLPTVASQKAYIDMLCHDLVSAEKAMQELREKNSVLLKENEELRARLATYEKQDEYLDLAICCLKKKPDGGCFPTPLCRTCKNPLSALGTQYLVCGECKIKLKRSEVTPSVRKALS